MGRTFLGLAIIAGAMAIVAALAFGALFLTEPGSPFRPFSAIASTVIMLLGMGIGFYVAGNPSSFRGRR